MEFFQDDNGMLSMTRLLMFMSWFPATYVLLKSPTENMLGWYLSAFVIGYVGSKINDTCTTIFKKG